MCLYSVETMKPTSLPLISRTSQALSRERAEELASLLKAIADPTRLQIIATINASANNETCVCDLTEPLGVSQPTVSHHLKVLTDAGLLVREKRGIWAWYSVNQDRWSQIKDLL